MFDLLIGAAVISLGVGLVVMSNRLDGRIEFLELKVAYLLRKVEGLQEEKQLDD